MMDFKELLTKRVKEVIEPRSLEKKLRGKKKLRIKYGIDPTSASIHLGHAVPIRKLKEFQDLGHRIVFIIGDYTTLIGDPSGKEKTRPNLSAQEIKKNAEGYFGQVAKILKSSRLEIHRQTEWFKDFDLKKIIELLGKVTVEQLLEHETFKLRLDKSLPFAMHELIYPLLQAYDSVAIKADVEVGGYDQKFNLLMGRQIQRLFGQKEQDLVMVDYLLGTDGKEKMGKSLGNTINLDHSPEEMFGRVMSIPDELIIPYFELTTDLSAREVKQIKKDLAHGKNPRDLKAFLARTVVSIYHSGSLAKEAEKEFNLVFRKKESPSNVIRKAVKPLGQWHLVTLLVETGLASSRSIARRLIQQKAVRVDRELITDVDLELGVYSGMLVQAGRRKFVQIK